MAWTDTSASAWGELDIQIGTPGALNVMSTSLASIGNVKEDSFSLETADGKKLQWFGTGHNLIDELNLQPTLTLKVMLKNLNLSNLQKFWNVTEALGVISVKDMVTSSKLSVSIAPKVVGAEKLDIPYCSVTMKAVYSQDGGWEQEVSFTMLRPKAGDPFFTISKVV